MAMIVCPVCEHSQAQGADCEVCGKQLLHGAAARPLVAPVEGFEPTRLEDVDADAETLPGLDPTGFAPTDADAGPAPELDYGRAVPVDVEVEPVPEVERASAEIPGDTATAVPTFATCRYCRTPALPGERVCGRCGMRLPVYDAAASEPVAPGRRCSCGILVTGPLCPGCGARMG